MFYRKFVCCREIVLEIRLYFFLRVFKGFLTVYEVLDIFRKDVFDSLGVEKVR